MWRGRWRSSPDPDAHAAIRRERYGHRVIRSLRGVLVEVSEDAALVEVGGVGLRVHVSTTTRAALPATGAVTRLDTHLVVREDALELFGFATAAERVLFEACIGVSSVGPRIALAVCGLDEPDALRRSIQLGDSRRLQAASGVGKRTAERLVLELRDRLGEIPDATPGDPGAPRGAGPVAEAREALVALGFGGDEVDHAFADAPDDLVETESLVRFALTRLRRA